MVVNAVTGSGETKRERGLRWKKNAHRHPHVKSPIAPDIMQNEGGGVSSQS